MAQKKIRVEILRTIAWVGKQWEIKEVGIAQARNQLIPQGIVREAKVESKNIPNVSEIRSAILADKANIVDKLNGKSLSTIVDAHGQKIAGHFDTKEVTQAIKKQYHVHILPEMITFEDVKHPKKLGIYDMHIDIAPDAYVRMKLEIRSS